MTFTTSFDCGQRNRNRPPGAGPPPLREKMLKKSLHRMCCRVIDLDQRAAPEKIPLFDF
jgi:hypothetical protein